MLFFFGLYIVAIFCLPPFQLWFLNKKTGTEHDVSLPEFTLWEF